MLARQRFDPRAAAMHFSTRTRTRGRRTSPVRKTRQSTITNELLLQCRFLSFPTICFTHCFHRTPTLDRTTANQGRSAKTRQRKNGRTDAPGPLRADLQGNYCCSSTRRLCSLAGGPRNCVKRISRKIMQIRDPAMGWNPLLFFLMLRLALAQDFFTAMRRWSTVDDGKLLLTFPDLLH